MRNPTHSVISILGLGIGLASVFLILLWVSYHRSFDSFHSKPIYQVMTNTGSNDGDIQTAAGAVYEVMEEARINLPEVQSITRVISSWRWPSEQCFKIDKDKPCIYNNGIFADSSFFKIFDFKILDGAINPLEHPKSIALSKSLATQLYGKENPVGKTYLVDNHFEVEITAVFEDVPSNSSLQFGFVAHLDVAHLLWMGNQFSEDKIKGYSYLTYLTLDGSPDQLNESINKLTSLKSYANTSLFLNPLSDEHLKGNFENGKQAGGLIDYVQMFVLFGLFILIMSAVNFINLATAKATVRSKEIGIRKVTGAGKHAIMFQFLADAFLKVVLATLIGLAIANAALPMLNALMEEHIVFLLDFSFISAVIVIAFLSTLLAGAYPAFVMSKFTPIKALKNKEGVEGGHHGLRKGLTVLQISFSVVIIIVTVIVNLQLSYLLKKDLGFDRKGIMMLEPTYKHIQNYEKFRNDLLENHLIKSIGVSNTNMVNANFATDNLEWPGKSESDQILFKLIGADQDLMTVFGLGFIAGDGFNEQDTLDQVIITRLAMDKMGLNEPIGTIIKAYGEEVRIVGVIEDFNTESLHKMIMPTIIYKVARENSGTFYIRYDHNNAAESIAAIKSVYSKYEQFFTMKYHLLDEDYQKRYQSELMMSRLSAAIMVIAVVIALIGILGLSTYNVIRRFKEIGIRKVFGASVMQITALLSKDFAVMGIVANLIAWPVAWYIANDWLTGFAYRISIPIQLFGFSFVLIIGFIVALVFLQSLKAAMMNPTDVIRED